MTYSKNGADPTTGFFGTPQMRAIQKAQDAQAADLADRPGAVLHARVFTSDDPDALGWDVLREVLARDGMISLRGASSDVLTRAEVEFAPSAPVAHHWDIFRADADTLRRVCGPLACGPLPHGLKRISKDALTPERVGQVQEFLSAQGVLPFSRDTLMGRVIPGRLTVIVDEDDKIAAAGFAAMPHNRHSPFHGDAWVGLVAVDPAWRGRGLGRLMDAICNADAVESLGAAGSIEFVARDNSASRAMLESCGLRMLQDRRVVVYSDTSQRLTR